MRTSYFSSGRIRYFYVLLAAAFLCCAIVPAQDPVLPPGVLSTFRGHTADVYSITFSPDGKHVLTGSFDKSIKLWDAATGKELKSYEGPNAHQQIVLAIAFSPDGRSFASGASDNQVKIWDAPVGPPEREFVQADGTQAIDVSPDGTKLAGAGRDGAINIWNVVDGKALFGLKGHVSRVVALSYGGNGQFLASAGDDRTVRLWNPTNGQTLGTLGAGPAAITGLVTAPGANTVYTASEDGAIRFWQMPVKPPRPLAVQPAAVVAMCLSADSQLVVTGSADKMVRTTDFGNGQSGPALGGSTGPVVAVAVSNNKTIVAGATADGKVILWNRGDAKVLNQIPAGGTISGLAFHPNDQQILAATSDGFLRLWTVQPDKKPGPAKAIKELKAHEGGVTCAVFHNTGAQVLSGGADKAVKLWDWNSGKTIRTWGPLSDPVHSVAYSRDFTRVAAAAGKIVKLWNVADGKELLSLVHPAVVSSFAFSHDQTKIVTGAADSLVRVWDLASGKEMEFFRQTGPVGAVAFHGSNTAVISTSNDKQATVHSLASNRLIVAGIAPIRSLALSPNGAYLVTGAADKSVKLWNVGNGVNERSFVGAEGPITALAISRDQVLLAVASADNSIRLFTFNDGRQQGILKVAGKVTALAFSANNQILAAACDDQTTLTWNVLFRPGQPVPAEFGRPGQSYRQPTAVTDVVFAPDSASLFTSGLDKTIRRWKYAADNPTKNFGHPNLVDAIAYNPAGTILATGCHDGVIRFWDLVKGQQIREIKAHEKPNETYIYCLAWTPDGKQVVSGSYDHTMKLWDAGTGKLVREFKAYEPKKFDKGHRDAVFTLAISPDGKFLASGGSDHMLKLWNMADGNVVREFVNPSIKTPADPVLAALNPPVAHPGEIYGVRYTPDGKYLVSAGNAPVYQGYLALWQVADGKMLYGETLTIGPVHSLALSPDGKTLALSCGPRGAQIQDVPCYLFRIPGSNLH